MLIPVFRYHPGNEGGFSHAGGAGDTDNMARRPCMPAELLNDVRCVIKLFGPPVFQQIKGTGHGHFVPGTDVFYVDANVQTSFFSLNLIGFA